MSYISTSRWISAFVCFIGLFFCNASAEPVTVLCKLKDDGARICASANRGGGGGAGTDYTINEFVVPNIRTVLVAWMEYYPSTCTQSSPGQWTLTSQPSYGTAAFAPYRGPLTNGDCPGMDFDWAGVYYTWTTTSKSAKYDSFTTRWTSPFYTHTWTFNMVPPSVVVNDVRLNDASSGGVASVTINAPADAPKATISFTFSGRSANSKQTTTDTYGKGTHNIPINRPMISKGTYDKVEATWNINSTGVSGSYSPNISWDVLGVIRYTQYNTQSESACSGSATPVWIVDSLSACNFTQATLRSDFASQVYINGTGASLSFGTLKTGVAT